MAPAVLVVALAAAVVVAVGWVLWSLWRFLVEGT
jgi:hypothetical protein